MKFSQLAIGAQFKAATGTGTKTGPRSAEWLTGEKAGQTTITSGSMTVLLANSTEDVTIKHNYKHKDSTAAKRNREKRKKASEVLLSLGFTSAEALITAIVNGEVEIRKVK